MLSETPEPGSAHDWLRCARSDLALAQVGLQPGVMYNALCFHAQQAVEKSIKAVLTDRQIAFRRAYNIAYLLTLLPSDIDSPPEAIDAAGLTIYAVITRYPGDYEEITHDMYRDAIRVASAIVTWAARIVG